MVCFAGRVQSETKSPTDTLLKRYVGGRRGPGNSRGQRPAGLQSYLIGMNIGTRCLSLPSPGNLRRHSRRGLIQATESSPMAIKLCIGSSVSSFLLTTITPSTNPPFFYDFLASCTIFTPAVLLYLPAALYIPPRLLHCQCSLTSRSCVCRSPSSHRSRSPTRRASKVAIQ